MNDNDNINPQPKPLNPTEALHKALLHTQPEARPEFRRALEDQLAARIMNSNPAPAAQPADERTIVMTTTTAPSVSMSLNGHEAYPTHESAPESDMPSIETLTDVSHFRRFTLPLTLVAALVIGMLIFPTLISMRDKNGNIGAIPPAFGVNPEVTADVTDTPPSFPLAATSTPPPLINVVVASRHISRGQQISADDLKVVSWDERYVPINAFVNTSVLSVAGQFARTDIFRESPILQTVLGASAADAAEVSEPLPSHLTVEVIVAVQPVAVGTILSKEMVAMRLYPRFALPPGTFTDTEAVIGQRAMTHLYREMPIIDTQIGIAYRTYILQEGDHPSLIADRFGVSLEDLFELNNLDESSSLLLQVGDTLLLPPDENGGASTAAGGGLSAGMTFIAIPLSRLTNQAENTGDGTDLVGFDHGSDVAIIRNRPETGIPSTRMTVIVPSARLMSARLEVFAEGYASFIVSGREAEALNSIISYSDDLFTLYPIPETQPESAPVVIVVTHTPAPTATPDATPTLSPESSGMLLPPGTRMIALPFDRFDSVANAVKEGDRIDIVHTPADSGEPTLVVQAARVVYIGEFPADGSIIGFAATPVVVGTPMLVATPEANQGVRPNIVAVVVSPDEAEALVPLLESNVPLTFVLRPAGQAALDLTPTVTPTATPAPSTILDLTRILPPLDTRMVVMPVDPVLSLVYAMQAGDRIDIIYPQPDLGEPMIVAQAARLIYIGEFPSDDFIIGIDQIVGISNISEGSRPDIVAFAVSPEEAETLSALLDSDTTPPLTVLPSPAEHSKREETFGILMDTLVNLEALPEVGDFVDVYATLSFIDIDDEFQQVVPETESALKTTQLVARDALVVAVDKEANLIRLSVSQQEKTVLEYVDIWRAPITLVPSREPGFGYGPRSTMTPMPTMIPVMTATPVAQSETTTGLLNGLLNRLEIPVGYRAVLVPMDRLTHPVSIGDRVNMFITFRFVDKDEEYQTIQNPSVDAVEDGRLMHQKVITDAHVLGVFRDENLIGLALKPADAVTLTYLLESQTPIMFLPETLGQMASEMTSVEGGTFEMGTTLVEVGAAVLECEKMGGQCLIASGNDSMPAHEVTLRDFAIDRTEVSNAQYVNFLNWLGRAPGNGCGLDGMLYPCITGTDDPAVSIRYDGESYHLNDETTAEWPVTHVTWYGADAYCRALGRRLPTEAEWERAARGADNFIYPWGNEWDYTAANTRRAAMTLDAPTFVTAYPDITSPFGALNMAGNAAEWVADWYQDSYYQQSAEATNPRGPAAGIEKVVRGGSWAEEPFAARAVHRQSAEPESGSERIGFRCAVGAD